jgi:EAL domain-containing protein (putative c-di-GMP-specific phosphodiesterase class I)/GGDEF domain-containing protein
MENKFKNPLEIILDPVVIVDKNYNIVFANKKAKTLLNVSEKTNKKCYEQIFGFPKPCWNYEGYHCPIKEKERKVTSLVHYLPLNGKLEKFFLRQYSSKGFYSELFIPYEDVKKVILQPETVKRKYDEFYIPKKEFESILKHLSNQKKKFFLISVNIKKLKYINEIYGIPAGDLVIKAVEQKLGFLVKRFNLKFSQVAGGLFILVLNKTQEEVERIEQELYNLLKNLQITYLGQTIKTKVSITTIEVNPQKIKTIPDIYKLILYAEKKAGDQKIGHIFEKEQEQFYELIAKKEKGIRQLQEFLEKKSITFFLQPIVDLRTEEISHFEILMRFIEDGKVIGAGVYIDLIYELGMLIDFDMLLLEKLKKKANELQKLGKPIFINTSGDDLRFLSYRERLKDLLTLFDEKGISLSLEITEQVLFKEWEFIETLTETYKLSFAVDDFGTGYSSLKMVADIAQKGCGKYLKLDCSIIKNFLRNKYIYALVESIATFAKNSDLKVVAECVENKEIVNALKEKGIDYGQGYYFYKPMPLEEALNLVSH